MDSISHELDRPYIHDLDQLPFVSKVYAKYLNIKDYYYGHISLISIFTSRGCNLSVLIVFQNNVWRFWHRSPKSIADELIG